MMIDPLIAGSAKAFLWPVFKHAYLLLDKKGVTPDYLRYYHYRAHLNYFYNPIAFTNFKPSIGIDIAVSSYALNTIHIEQYYELFLDSNSIESALLINNHNAPYELVTKRKNSAEILYPDQTLNSAQRIAFIKLMRVLYDPQDPYLDNNLPILLAKLANYLLTKKTGPINNIKMHDVFM